MENEDRSLLEEVCSMGWPYYPVNVFTAVESPDGTFVEGEAVRPQLWVKSKVEPSKSVTGDVRLVDSTEQKFLLVRSHS